MGTSTSHRLKELFDRYLRRELSPAEVAELVSLLGRPDSEEILTEPMRRLWEQLKPGPGEKSGPGEKLEPEAYVVDWVRMYQKVSGRSELLRVWGWRGVAAIFLGLAGLAAYWSVAYRRPVIAGAAGASVAAASRVVKKDSVGTVGVMSWQTAQNKKVIHLPDGSMVILNNHSRMEYRESGMREVVLNGEAYFDIVHRPERPFLVHTGKIVTRVLGTAFNIKAYPTENSIEVTVDHGKVQVLKGATNMGLLSDKQQMRYDLGTEVFHAQEVSLKTVMAWKPAEISFDDITLEEATRRIGERFKVGFDFVNPALKGCRITATFYMEDDLDQIMTVVCGVNQSRFVIGGNRVKIDGKGCN